MGCYIHTAVFKKTEMGLKQVDFGDILSQQRYDVFAFLAGVRNYAEVPPIAEGRELPPELRCEVYPTVKKQGFGGAEYDEDVDGVLGSTTDLHSVTWVNVGELVDFDYSQTFEDRRDPKGAHDSVPPGQGRVRTYRDFLADGDQYYFNQIKRMVSKWGDGDPSNLILVMGFDG